MMHMKKNIIRVAISLAVLPSINAMQMQILATQQPTISYDINAPKATCQNPKFSQEPEFEILFRKTKNPNLHEERIFNLGYRQKMTRPEIPTFAQVIAEFSISKKTRPKDIKFMVQELVDVMYKRIEHEPKSIEALWMNGSCDNKECYNYLHQEISQAFNHHKDFGSTKDISKKKEYIIKSTFTCLQQNRKSRVKREKLGHPRNNKIPQVHLTKFEVTNNDNIQVNYELSCDNIEESAPEITKNMLDDIMNRIPLINEIGTINSLTLNAFSWLGGILGLKEFIACCCKKPKKQEPVKEK